MGLWADAKNIRDKDPAARNVAEVILLYPGFHVLVTHRIAHWLYNRRLLFLARLVSQLARHLTGIEIHPGAKIGQRLFIDHGMGIVFGETTEIGDNCTIYHGVTLGGTGKDVGKRHPTLGDRVMVSSGAKVLGPFTVGNDAKIGSGAVVLKEVPPGCTVVGVPGKIVKGPHPMTEEMDQVHLPDPVAREMEQLKKRIAKLENMISQYEERNGEKYESI